MNAAVGILFVAIGLARVARAGEKPYFLPRLPVTVRVVPADDDRFCNSTDLAAVLKQRAFLWVVGPGESDPGWKPDFRLECSGVDDQRFLIRLVRLRDADVVYEMRVTRVPPVEDQTLTARLVGQTLAEKQKVIEAALREYGRSNSLGLAENGAQALLDHRWQEAADYLHMALESGQPSGALHFGLARAYANLGDRARMVWHYLAYLDIEKKDFDDAPEQPLLELATGAVTTGGAEKAVELRGRAKEFADADRWNDALNALKLLAQQAPWNSKTYQSIAEVYDTVGWRELASIWRTRAALAKRVARNRKNQDKVRAFLDEP